MKFELKNTLPVNQEIMAIDHDNKKIWKGEQENVNKKEMKKGQARLAFF